VPDWSPDWSDVRFDHATAESAAAACERAARVLADAARTNAAVVHAAVAGAQGPRVERVSRRFGRLQDQAHTAEAHLRRAATELRAASERARADQVARLDARRRWQAEADVERLLEAAAHAEPASVPHRSSCTKTSLVRSP